METEAQLAYLTGTACDQGQAYLFNETIPAAVFPRLVNVEKQVP
jgi:EAL domain-containing protein (putative c-di-GMP-specific phosphodiesterase class I)